MIISVGRVIMAVIRDTGEPTVLQVAYYKLFNTHITLEERSSAINQHPTLLFITLLIYSLPVLYLQSVIIANLVKIVKSCVGTA